MGGRQVRTQGSNWGAGSAVAITAIPAASVSRLLPATGCMDRQSSEGQTGPVSSHMVQAVPTHDTTSTIDQEAKCLRDMDGTGWGDSKGQAGESGRTRGTGGGYHQGTGRQGQLRGQAEDKRSHRKLMVPPRCSQNV